MLTKKICFIGALAFGVFFVACENNKNSLEPTKADQERSFVSGAMLAIDELQLFIPEFVPDVVNQEALDVAAKNSYSNIRIVGVKEEKNPTFLVNYFDDDLSNLQSFAITTDSEFKNIVEKKEVTLTNKKSLGKPATSYCWHLAIIYQDYYRTGNNFQFSQATTTYGWYHKVANNLSYSLGCCWGDYPGTFNNNISSFYWEDHDQIPLCGMIARPVCFHVFDRIIRDQGGDDKKFEDKTKPTQYPPIYYLTCGDLSMVFPNMDNNISSIDMFYRVYGPE